MIRISKKEFCCGCNACVQSCPVSCIQMCEDKEGFWYPKVQEDICINCGLCERVCPCLNSFPEREPRYVFSVKSKDKIIRKESSSGGLFSELARWILSQGGVVFAARFTDDWNVSHCYVEDEENLRYLRGSKYVQSKIGDTYVQTRSFLKQERWVLFVGTSCQIAGLNLFLKKKYDRLITADVVCHGVPSPKVWNIYLKGLTKNEVNNISNIQFRSKLSGWKKYSFVCKWGNTEYREIFTQNLYMRGFLKDLYLRPSCYNCLNKMFATNSDLTLADYWGIQHLQPELDDDLGFGIAFVHSEKILSILNDIYVDKKLVIFAPLIKYNPSIKYATPKISMFKRHLFFAGLNHNIPILWLLKVFTKRLNLRMIIRKITRKE